MKKFLLLLIVMHLVISSSFSQWTIEADYFNSHIFTNVCTADSGTAWACGYIFDRDASQNKFIAHRSSSGTWDTVTTNGIYDNQILTGISAQDYLNAWVTDCYGASNGGAHIYRTTDGGQNWTVQISTGGTLGYFNDIEFSKKNPSTGYAWSDPPFGNGTPLKIYRTTNYGNTWNEFPVAVDTHYVGSTGSMSVTDSNHAWFGLYRNLGGNDAGKILYTTNGGVNFSVNNMYFNITSVNLIEYKWDNTFALATAGAIDYYYKTTNGGNSWQYYYTLGFGAATRIVSIPNTNVWYISAPFTELTGYRIFKSINNGTTWDRMSMGEGYFHVSYMDAVMVNSKVYAYAVTYSGKVFRLVDTVSLIGINKNSNELPASFLLSQNYPNPFNPATSIKYSIPKQTLVKLVVYDVLGREVAKLVNEVKHAGNYSVSFDASVYASGVYFYRIEAGDFTDVKKMVLIK